MKLYIYRAVKTNVLTQGFYENKNPYYATVGMKYHGGYDWLTIVDEPVYFDCSVQGMVLNCEIDGAGGLGINVITETEEGIFKHRFWHLKEFKVKAGDLVDTGDLLGISDHTGLATANHLHRDMKEMIKNPISGAYSVKDPANGTFGTIPNERFFENMYVVDFVNSLKSQVSILTKMVEIIKQILGLKNQ